MNQCFFRHSAQNMPLKDLMKLVSVGLPGHDALLIGPEIDVSADEFQALVYADGAGIADAAER